MMKAALILGADTKVRRWQYEAAKAAINDGLEITKVLHCKDERRRSLRLRNLAYYALALAARPRMSMVAEVDLAPLLPCGRDHIGFNSLWEGNWQRIPPRVVDELADVDVIIKFGMNLLKDPQALPARYGVLSFHHGDPAKYRGRPAGFYELQAGDAVMGIIVQRLSNTLDGGAVLARAYSRVVPSSYSATLNGAYEAGIPLLGKALAALNGPAAPPADGLGKNRTLPSNAAVLRVTLEMTRRKCERAAYGAFREKRWRVGRLLNNVIPERAMTIKLSDVTPLPIPKGYTFVADPMGVGQGKLYCEVMNKRTGKGEIAAFSNGQWRFVDVPIGGGHLSYPQILEHEGQMYLFPEMASVSAPTLFSVDQTGLVCSPAGKLRGLEAERLVDGTLFPYAGNWYLFAGSKTSSSRELQLWVSDKLMGPYCKHPKSPVCLDPRSARMAGPIIQVQEGLYRPGQDGSMGYGRGITISRIELLTPSEYCEKVVSCLSMSGALGPHTILGDAEGYWLDFYTERWTLLAGYRRLRARLGP